MKDLWKNKRVKVLAVMQAAASSESFSNPGLLCLFCVSASVFVHLRLRPLISDKRVPYGLQSLLRCAHGQTPAHKDVGIVFVLFFILVAQEQ